MLLTQLHEPGFLCVLHLGLLVDLFISCLLLTMVVGCALGVTGTSVEPAAAELEGAITRGVIGTSKKEGGVEGPGNSNAGFAIS